MTIITIITICNMCSGVSKINVEYILENKFIEKELIMDNLQTHFENYLNYCNMQKCLDEKTLKAYRIDLRQFSEWMFPLEFAEVSLKLLKTILQSFISNIKAKL